MRRNQSRALPEFSLRARPLRHAAVIARGAHAALALP
jgi:hypothetical protein